MAIGFGIIGLDHWYNAFPMMDAIRAHPGAELIAIAHRDSQQAAEIAARYQPVELASIDAILANPRVDAVCTFTSTDENANASVRALDAGKHVIAIKPMAMTLDEADAVVAAAARSGKHYLPGDQFRRFTPANVQIKRWVEEGRIGDVLAAHCLFRAGLPQAWPGATEPGWFADPTRAPGGAFIDHAIYHVDVLRWLLGAEVNAVTAVTANVRHHAIPVEDWGHAVLSFRNGKVGTIEDTWTSGPGTPKEAIEVVGSKGSITWDTASNRIWLNGDFGLDGWVQVNPPRGAAGFFGHAIDVLSGKAEPVSSAASARANLAACLAVYESARTGREVKVSV
jgi:predicted dehydrogenase